MYNFCVLILYELTFAYKVFIIRHNLQKVPMKKKSYTFVVDLHHSKIIIDGNKGNQFILLVDHDVMSMIRHSEMRIVLQHFKDGPRVLYYLEDKLKYNLSHFVLGVVPNTRVAFRNNNTFDLRRENLLVNRRNIHF